MPPTGTHHTRDTRYRLPVENILFMPCLQQGDRGRLYSRRKVAVWKVMVMVMVMAMVERGGRHDKPFEDGKAKVRSFRG